MKTQSGIEFETKPLTFAQRCECNDLIQGGKNLFSFSFYAMNARYGLKTLDGEAITDENAIERVNALGLVSIKEIGLVVFAENNLTDKKKS